MEREAVRNFDATHDPDLILRSAAQRRVSKDAPAVLQLNGLPGGSPMGAKTRNRPELTLPFSRGASL